ncbi:Striatin [Anabarilius grahami]|uniref:Striatin n=1 Tax=Anabarilius grahami TaxID=495550 RepID=A0A3N0YBU9_ANAGA|nr:Striatin [Anabarilius grahami]
MDEQAGPGVFFNNNNNSVLPGGAKAPQPGDGGETARAQYSIPGILHFLQHEWARFEVERAQWEVERAELQLNNNKAGESHAAKMTKVFSFTLFKPESTLMERLRKKLQLLE